MDNIKSDLGKATGLRADVETKKHGGSGGTSFTLTNGSHAVTKLKVWTDTGCGFRSDRDLVKDIEITWDDGTKRHITGNQDGNSSDITFQDKEKVSTMTLRTGNRVDKVSLTTTNSRKFDEGQDHGTAYSQRVGNGVLLGFEGTFDAADKELISIGSKFATD
ncbi:hypothetical protein DL768_002171 [Monosporascus sp. mg162]|nr:hypothetical protein DL768_002171 [Monosporascus sp. mg162]